jgi:hypothetical protein
MMVVGYIIGYHLKQYNVIYHGPDSNEIKKYIYYDSEEDKYYRFTPVPYICPPSYNRV